MLKRPIFFPGCTPLIAWAPLTTSLALRCPIYAKGNFGKGRGELRGQLMPMLMIHSEAASGETHAVAMTGLN